MKDLRWPFRAPASARPPRRPPRRKLALLRGERVCWYLQGFLRIDDGGLGAGRARLTSVGAHVDALAAASRSGSSALRSSRSSWSRSACFCCALRLDRGLTLRRQLAEIAGEHRVLRARAWIGGYRPARRSAATASRAPVVRPRRAPPCGAAISARQAGEAVGRGVSRRPALRVGSSSTKTSPGATCLPFSTWIATHPARSPAAGSSLTRPVGWILPCATAMMSMRPK